jgi:diguanylate cyclase (GGDEF)-like protein
MYQGMRVPALEAETETDAKTGLANPRRFNRAGEREIRRALRYERPLSLLMCDVDHMNVINNTSGHLAGDAVLMAVSNALSDCVREDDLAARFGGEEFAVLMPEAGLEEAVAAAERIRAMVAGLRVSHPATGTLVRVTISVGAATLQPDDGSLDDLVHGADLALYAAKAAGRNTVEARGRLRRRESR